MLSEQELIEGCIRENPRVQEQLYKQYASRMFALCLRYSSSRMEAEDTLHEGFMRVFQSIGRYTSTGSFEGWIKRIMINSCLKKYHANKHMYLKQTNIDDYGQLNEEYHPTGYDKLQVTDLVDMVQKLAPGFRLVFNLYALEGYNHKEIGDMLDISEGTSKSQLSRARQILQKMLGYQKHETTDV